MRNLFVEKLQNFGGLTPEATVALTVATARWRVVPAKQDLIREGDRPGPVFVMLEGWACRYKILPDGTRQILAFLMPGDCCDLHIGLLAEMDHGIQTITSARVATIGRKDMEMVMDRHPGVAKAMYIVQLIDEGVLRSWITSMGRRNSIERVSHLVCELYLRASNVGIASDDMFAMPLSQILLADALGMTPVHLNRMLKELRQLGAMRLDRGRMFVTDPAKLAKIAGFDENYLHRRVRLTA